MPRHRKTDAAKKTAGTFRPDRAKATPKIEGMTTVPPAPEHLTAQARTEWHRLAPLICEQGTMGHADLRGFEMLCEVLATAQMAQEAVGKDGLTVLGAGGTVRAHPAIKTMEAARSQATRLLIEYGLTPRARGHVEAAPDATPGNPFGDL